MAQLHLSPTQKWLKELSRGLHKNRLNAQALFMKNKEKHNANVRLAFFSSFRFTLPKASTSCPNINP